MAEAIGSMCIGVCKMHPIYRVCQGCYRSLLEIQMWPLLNDAAKEKTMRNIKIKKKLYGDINANI